MTKEKTILYPGPMLSNVDYNDLGIDFDPFTFELTNLEYRTKENCSDFLNELEPALLSANMIQLPEMIVAHLCCYLGVTTAIFNHGKSKDLVPDIHILLRQHAELALSKFKYHLSNLNDNNKSLLVEQLRENAPGSIVAQTLRLGRVIKDMMGNLSDHRISLTKKQKDFICPINKFFDFLIPLLEEQYKEWRKDLDGLSINYAINQLTIQIGWLIGYFSYLDKKPNTNSYLEYGVPCISLYIEHINKLQQLLLSNGRTLSCLELIEDENQIDNPEIKALLNEINDLSEQTHAEILPATTKFQKESAIAQAGLEKLVIELVLEHMEVKIIYMSLFYFWFTLDAPLRGITGKALDKLSPFDELGNIINITRKTTFELPDIEFSSNLKMLNSKMDRLKSNLRNPEEFDNVPQDLVEYHTNRVNTTIHTLTSEYLKQGYHPEIVANVLFSQWLRLSVFYGVTEKEWQKTDYYLPEILAAVRNYIPTIIH